MKKGAFPTWVKDTVVSMLILAAATALGAVFERLSLNEPDIIMLYIIAVLFISIATSAFSIVLFRH